MDSVCIGSYFAFQPLYIRLFEGGWREERARGGGDSKSKIQCDLNYRSNLSLKKNLYSEATLKSNITRASILCCLASKYL